MTSKQFFNAIRASLFLLVISLAVSRVSHAQFQGGGRGAQSTDNPLPGNQLPGIQRQGTSPNSSTSSPSSTASTTTPPPPESDMVLLTVSVTVPENRPVPSLSRDRFQILEDGVEQNIAYFWEDNRPVSVGLLIDDSDYMSLPDGNSKEESVRDFAAAFLKAKGPEDEYFVLQFSQFPRMTVSYTTDAKLAPSTFRVVTGTPTPDTALNDALYLGLESIKEAANPRKALLAVTGGGDKGCDGSMQTMKIEQLLAFAMKQPVQIYSILISDDWATANGGKTCDQITIDAGNLEDLGKVTGGKAFLSVNSQGGVDSIAAEVARALKKQYLIGFKSTNAAKDGKRRGIKVKVTPPEGSPKLNVWTQNAYNAPKEKPLKTSN